MNPQQLFVTKVPQKTWNFDIILCSFFLFTIPYNFTDVLIRTFLGNNLFQFDWIIIVVACLRLGNILLTKKSIENRFLRYALITFVPLFIVIVYTFAVTTFQIEFLQENGLYYSSISDGFIFRRGVKYLAYTALALYFASVVNTWQKFYTVLLALLASLCIAEILGLIQAIVFLGTGVDIFPITRTRETGLFYQSATVDFVGIKFLRIKSLAHEPKGLAGMMYILFIFKFYSSSLLLRAKQYIKIPNFFATYLQITWPLTILVLLLTFSGSGLLSFGFIFTVIFLTSLGPLIVSGRISPNLIFVLLFILGASLVMIQAPEKVNSFFDVSIMRRASGFFEERTIESLYSGSTDPEDTAAIINVIKFPIVVLTGVGFGGYSNLALPIVVSMYGSGIPIETASAFSRNILIELLFSSGLVGIAGCLFFASRLLRNLRFYPDVIMPLALVIVSSFLIRSSEVLFFVFIGIVCAVNFIILNEMRYEKIPYWR
jgi:hypothetical protein